MTAPPDDGWDQALAELLAGQSEAAPEAAPEAAQSAVLAFGIGDKRLLAALLKGPGIAARALDADGMGMAVLDDPSEQAAIGAARTASGTLRGQQVLLLRRGESADPAAGDIQAYLYLDGLERQRISPGLVLARSPQLLEDLLIDPESAASALAGAVDVTKLSAADAIAIIGRSVGAARKAARGRRSRGRGQDRPEKSE
ncbi:MAG: hypothetical protein LBD70_07495 [Bifidobacteriaceae bacterium]|jgi:hypothetical protein|nr:hypothetical protein [Bifidobacteriaceae bacterium]